MKVIDVYCELRTRKVRVGRLIQDDQGYEFQYADSWLDFDGAFDIGPDIPLSRKKYRSTSLPDSFLSRIPPRNSANYARYCEDRGISANERSEMVLLSTIGHKGPSSFVFEKSFELQDRIVTRERLQSMRGKFSLRTIAIFFNISMGSLQKILAGKIAGPSFQIIEICLLEIGAFNFRLKRAHELSDETRLELKKWAKEHVGPYDEALL